MDAEPASETDGRHARQRSVQIGLAIEAEGVCACSSSLNIDLAGEADGGRARDEPVHIDLAGEADRVCAEGTMIRSHFRSARNHVRGRLDHASSLDAG